MKKSVLILGGGIAGLAAARALVRRGISVTLVEAQSRLGGRIHTIHDGNVPIELGAEFIHGESKPLLETIREGALAIQDVADRTRLFANGHFDSLDIWEHAEEIFKRISPGEPDTTFEKFLAGQMDIEDREKNLMRHSVEDFNAAYANRISTRALLRAERAADQMNGAHHFRIVRGYATVVDFLAGEIKRLGGVLVKNTRAKQINWKPGSVDVSVERENRVERLAANAAIVTLPLGILKTDEVKFLPPLPEKFEAARGLEFGNVVRIVFQFRESFWEDYGFVHVLDRPLLTWWNDPRGPIVTGWAGGPHADVLLKHSRLELEEMGLEILGDILSERKDVLRSRLVASHYKNWTDDPHIRGAYSYIPVNGLDLPQVLAAPIAGTLFFAGEATVADAQTGTVFGAMESGLRAAREILDSN